MRRGARGGGGIGATSEAARYFHTALDYCLSNGFADEVKYARSKTFDTATGAEFLSEYIWVVLNSGMKNQVAKAIFDKLADTQDINTVGHPGKRKAIKKALKDYQSQFQGLKAAEDKLAYLEHLDWIGPITKYHLAKNLGMDFAKPDRHLVRLAERFGFSDVNGMCQRISESVGERVGVVDVVIWRYCNMGEPTASIPRQTTLTGVGD